MMPRRSALAVVSVLVGVILTGCRKPSRSVSPISTTCVTGVELSSTPHEPAAAHDANDFTFALYRATSSCHKENALVSGFVARHTLGTLAAASVTPAPADIWRSLGYGASETAGRDELAGWQAAANGVSFTSGARVFHDTSLRLDAAFERRAVTAFGQHFEAIDLQRKPDTARERIGAWVSESTGGQLSGPIPKAILDKDTSVVVGTAFGMSADWDTLSSRG